MKDKNSSPIYKKLWFWYMVVIVVVVITELLDYYVF